MATETITITLKLFAIYQEALGVAEKKLELPVNTTAEDVLDQIVQAYPYVAKWKDVTRFGINLQFVEPDTSLQQDDELVLIPPVSGG